MERIDLQQEQPEFSDKKVWTEPAMEDIELQKGVFGFESFMFFS